MRRWPAVHSERTGRAKKIGVHRTIPRRLQCLTSVNILARQQCIVKLRLKQRSASDAYRTFYGFCSVTGNGCIGSRRCR